MTSLCQMTNYIFNKKVDKDKVNDWNNLKGTGKETWNFISVLYDVGWDVLIADSNGSSFRNKVVAKFIPKINTSNTSKVNNSKSADKPVSINRLPPLISAKSPKEVNKIFKYFKKNNQSKGKTKFKQLLLLQSTTLEKFLKSRKLSLIYR